MRWICAVVHHAVVQIVDVESLSFFDFPLNYFKLFHFELLVLVTYVRGAIAHVCISLVIHVALWVVNSINHSFYWLRVNFIFARSSIIIDFRTKRCCFGWCLNCREFSSGCCVYELLWARNPFRTWCWAIDRRASFLLCLSLLFISLLISQSLWIQQLLNRIYSSGRCFRLSSRRRQRYFRKFSLPFGTIAGILSLGFSLLLGLLWLCCHLPRCPYFLGSLFLLLLRISDKGLLLLLIRTIKVVWRKLGIESTVRLLWIFLALLSEYLLWKLLISPLLSLVLIFVIADVLLITNTIRKLFVTHFYFNNIILKFWNI